MAQKHYISCIEHPMTVGTQEQGPQKRYRRLRFPSFDAVVWAEKNPLLQKGELGHEKDTGRFKVGDGVTYWVDLPYNSVGAPAKVNGHNVLEIIAGKNVEIEQNGNVLTIGASGVGYSKQEIDDKFTVANAQIDANAVAIAKTRDDYMSADTDIMTIINNHAEELTTLHNDIDELGDDVAGIQAKIPESTSETNPLINKQQLLDEEMDIRDDLNEMASELQTQITAQAAEIATKQDQLTAGDNIIISNNVISATGAGGGAGFDIVVVQELPATGQKGIIYLLAKDGTAPDVYDEYVWITATQTFELIGSTKVDLSGYLPLSGGTITGPITLGMTGDPYSNVDVLKSSSGASLVTGMIESGTVSTLAVRTPLTIFKELLPLADVGQSFSKVPRIYLEKINNGADISIPTTGGTMALAENVETAIADAVANIDALPDQSGNAGKVLATDGSTASWQEAPASGTKVIIKRYN